MANETNLPTFDLSDDQRKNAASEGLKTFIRDDGKVRPDLLGGSIPKDVDLQTLINTGSLEDIENTFESLTKRAQGRDVVGYKGLWGEGGYSNFKTTAGGDNTTSGYVDPYGKTTPIGQQAELAANPELPEGTELSLDRITTSANEFLDSDKYKVTPTLYNVEAATAAVANAADPTKSQSQSFEAQQSFEEVAKQQVDAARQEGLTDFVEPQQGTIDVDSTVQGQLAKLMQQFENGQIPAYAAGAIRNAEQRLAARGMGASSMAGSALVQAAMEASTPIAAADAATYARMNELNLNNRQAAEVINAQQTLQLDLANLSNEQQARVTNTQNRVQALFTDQAAVNSSKQFNAQSEQQNDQFFAGLSNQVAQFNAAQQNGINEFNAGQKNALSQFNSTLSDRREQFNAQNSIVIDQANAVYRREVNTANTAIANAENEFNVRNLFNISRTAQANILQEARDAHNFARLEAVNETAFQNQLAMASFAFDKDLDLATTIATSRVTSKILGGVVDTVLSGGKVVAKEIFDEVTEDEPVAPATPAATTPTTPTIESVPEGDLFT
jgi:hypothetical protein